MQLQFDFDTPSVCAEKFFYMTIGRFADEICYTTKPSYSDASPYTEKWIVYSYQQSFNF